jgi:bacteriorhodopsin
MPRWVWVAIGLAAVLVVLWLLGIRFGLSVSGG